MKDELIHWQVLGRAVNRDIQLDEEIERGDLV